MAQRRASVPPVEPTPSESPSPSDELTTPTPSPSPLGGAAFTVPPGADPTTIPSLEADEGSASDAGDESAAGPDPSDEPPTSSRGSSGSAISRRTIRDAARKAVLMAGGVAHQLLARDDAAQRVGLYLAEQDDAEAIGDPLASIANRHNTLGAAGNPDLADAIAALIGLAVYAVKQLNAAAAARDLRAHKASAPPEDADQGQDAPGATDGPPWGGYGG